VVRREGLRRGRREGVYLRYTDGLGTISLFQFRTSPSSGPSDPSGRRDGKRGHGRFRSSGDHRPPSRQIGDLRCTAMGDVAEDELRKMLDSLPTMRTTENRP
jgi:hypothetical protein